jgi:hypothetical protein
LYQISDFEYPNSDTSASERDIEYLWSDMDGSKPFRRTGSSQISSLAVRGRQSGIVVARKKVEKHKIERGEMSRYHIDPCIKFHASYSMSTLGSIIAASK